MALSTHAPLGVFDSGVGGLTVLGALKRQLPGESFIYLGDTARLPYGSKPLELVCAFAEEISFELVRRGVKGIVVACNTASAASLPALAAKLPVPVWGVIEPGVQAALRVAPGGRVGVLGTAGTVKTRAYQERLEAAGCTVWAQPCPLFVPIVEEGVSDTVIAKRVAEHYLQNAPRLDAVILGCTHYPALKVILSEVLGEIWGEVSGVAGSAVGRVPLVDSAEETARVVAHDLELLGLAAPLALHTQATQNQQHTAHPTVHHLVTGDVASYAHTARLLGGPEGTLERLTLGSSPQTVSGPAY